MKTLERINQLSAERTRLYAAASNGRRKDAAVLQRIHEISAEMGSLWEARRRERAGKVEGIDRVIDAMYASTYGRGYEDALAPPTVAYAENEHSSRKELVLAA